MSAKLKAAQFIVLFEAATLFAAVPVDFYATVSSSQDTNMISMTTDLFFTQFQSIDGYTVIDKRTVTYDAATAAPSTISFYAEIQESGDGSWICTLNAIKASVGKNVSETKKYESYYKILLDAKSSLENLLSNFEDHAIVPSASAQKSVSGSSADSSIEQIAGTWIGEPLVDKIMILRGGKGFIIFKNGASMSISVLLAGNSVTIKQLGKSNASYFPDLPRNIALQNAANAEPIVWNMTLTSSDIMSGTKTSLQVDPASATGVSYGETDVIWKKK